LISSGSRKPMNHNLLKSLNSFSVRHLMTRETLQPQDLPEGAASELHEYSELIGIKHQRLEAIDLLWIPPTGNLIELRVDFPIGMYQRQAEAAIERATTAFTQLLGQNYLTTPVNLFPVIERLYKATGDGTMVELAFMVSGSAQKHEKTRRDGQCCRVEAYHVGGVSVLDQPIEPYRTSVMWTVPIAEDVLSMPEVSLMGNSVDTAVQSPFLGEMIARNCANLIDYGHIRDRIISHLHSPLPDEVASVAVHDDHKRSQG
ncbi:hypothetical protein, partial [Komagataeibacter oboediens]|uniref:hypothetical protein n=1 Tax=Komagataeibacter oboediens TaxID=65958 RepID=UPI001F28F7BE